MQERGQEFEQAYLDSLRNKGLVISEPGSESPTMQRTTPLTWRIYDVNTHPSSTEQAKDYLTKDERLAPDQHLTEPGISYI